jgi:hypothetical protein
MSSIFYSALPLLVLLPLAAGMIIMARKYAMIPLASAFYLLLLGLFIIYLPMADVLLGVNSSFGFQLPRNPELDGRIAAVYILAIAGFGLGFFAFNFWKRKRISGPSLSSFRQLTSLSSVLYVFQLFCWFLYFFNLKVSGIRLEGIFDPFNQEERSILFSANYRFPLLELFSAAVPVALFLLFRLGKAKEIHWWFFFIFWLIMSLLGGWRFRIILFALFFVFHWMESRISLRKTMLFALLLTLSMAWLTLNRMAIAKRQFNLITFDIRQFDLTIFNNEFSNCRTFRACLSQEGWNRFPGFSGWQKESPESKPRIINFSKSWIPPGWPWNPNPALSQPEELFLLFGFPGLLLGMAGIGCFTAFCDRMRKDCFSSSLRIVLTAMLFQWVSRGYFPFQLKITFICLSPFLLLWLADRYLPRNPHENPT